MRNASSTVYMTVARRARRSGSRAKVHGSVSSMYLLSRPTSFQISARATLPRGLPPAAAHAPRWPRPDPLRCGRFLQARRVRERHLGSSG